MQSLPMVREKPTELGSVLLSRSAYAIPPDGEGE